MLAMQYTITLPADYDMAVIRKRIEEKGHLLDRLPGLGLKAYLVRERGVNGPVNQYAPFYLWTQGSAMSRFLWEGGGFQGIVTDFGRPPVRQWVGAGFALGQASGELPGSATITRESLPPDVLPQDALTGAKADLASRSQRAGVHCSAVAVDPCRWELVHFTLWAGNTAPQSPVGLRFQVLHLSSPSICDLQRAGLS